MNKLFTITIGALVLTVIGLGIGLSIKTPVVNNNVNIPEQERQFGLAQLSGDVLEMNGVKTHYYNSPMVVASTTGTPMAKRICFTKTPSATSTIELASAVFKKGAQIDALLEIGIASTALATTTRIATSTISANAQANVMASSTYMNNINLGAANGLIKPDQYLVWLLGSDATTTSGVCKAVFREI